MSDKTMINENKKPRRTKYGLRILNYSSGSIYSYNFCNAGNYKTKEAIFGNSLLSDFLLVNGLKRYECTSEKDNIKNEVFRKWVENENGSWTRDIICIRFDTSARVLINLWGEHSGKNIGLSEDEIKKQNKKNENKTQIKKVQELRVDAYVNGVTIEYLDTEITYRMLYRTTGKSKKGYCIFINSSLYEKAIDFLHMGKKFPDEEKHVVEISAYQSLVASNITGTIEIDPEKILVINDPVSFSKRNVVKLSDLLKEGEDNNKDNSSVSDNNVWNALFDGQGLIDCKVFDQSKFFDKKEKPNGYILLRQHFCKIACFPTDIKQFFKDYDSVE